MFWLFYSGVCNEDEGSNLAYSIMHSSLLSLANCAKLFTHCMTLYAEVVY